MAAATLGDEPRVDQNGSGTRERLRPPPFVSRTTMREQNSQLRRRKDKTRSKMCQRDEVIRGMESSNARDKSRFETFSEISFFSKWPKEFSTIFAWIN